MKHVKLTVATTAESSQLFFSSSFPRCSEAQPDNKWRSTKEVSESKHSRGNLKGLPGTFSGGKGGYLKEGLEGTFKGGSRGSTLRSPQGWA